MRLPELGRAWIALSLVVVILLLLSGCSGCESDPGDTEAVMPIRPEAIAPEIHTREAHLSALHIPIDIPLSEVKALVNKVVPESLFTAREMRVESGLLAVLIDLDIVRDGEIETYSGYGSIFNRLPIAASGRVFVPPGVWRPFETRFLLNTTTDLSLDADWKTQSSTSAAITWSDEPYITIAGIKIGLAGPAEGAMEAELANITPEIDRIIEEEVDLRSEVDKVWGDLVDPIKVSEEPTLWLSIRPESAAYRPPRTVGDTVLVELLVGAKVETHVGVRPPVVDASELPELTELTEVAAGSEHFGFSVHLPIRLEFDEAASLANGRLRGRTIRLENGVEIDLSNVELYGRAQTLIAKVDFDARYAQDAISMNGTVYFTGIPAYDSTSREVRVDSFAFDIRSRDALTQAAGWILVEGFLSEFQDELRFPLGDEIEFGRENLEEALRRRPIGRHILVHGSVERLEPGSIFLIDEGIELELFATGTLEARIRALDEAVKKVPKLVQ